VRTRPNAFSDRAVVSSSSIFSSLAGARVLERGGNVFDAAIATSSVLCVTQNNLCGLGGDMFALLRDSNGNIVDLNGSGRAFSALTPQFFTDRGMNEIPKRGEYSALTVPGIVMAWDDIHRKYCSMDIRELLKPAYLLARDGFPVTQNYRDSIEISGKFLGQYEGWRSQFMPDGHPPEAGAVFKQKYLAETFLHLMEDGLPSFYDGYLADRIIEGLKNTDVALSGTDLRKHSSTVTKPCSAEIEGFRIYETSPNSQGVTALLWLNLLAESGYDFAGEYLSQMGTILETGLIAYDQRDRYITDPDYVKLPEGFLSRDFAKQLINGVREEGAAGGKKYGQSDTTYFTITSSSGDSVSIIQSNYMGFGSGIMPDRTGFVLQNRGCYFSLDENHHNCIAPGKRTFHTLCAGMMENDGVHYASFGTMGGDIQPQVHIQMILRLIGDNSDPQHILDFPRWAFPYTIYEKPSQVICESDTVKENIDRSFRKLKVSNVGFSSQFGHAQITASLKNGTVAGGSDHRGDGISIPASAF